MVFISIFSIEKPMFWRTDSRSCQVRWEDLTAELFPGGPKEDFFLQMRRLETQPSAGVASKFVTRGSKNNSQQTADSCVWKLKSVQSIFALTVFQKSPIVMVYSAVSGRNIFSLGLLRSGEDYSHDFDYPNWQKDSCDFAWRMPGSPQGDGRCKRQMLPLGPQAGPSYLTLLSMLALTGHLPFNAGIDRATCHSMLALTGHLPFNAGIDRTLAIQCWHWQDTCHSMLALTGHLPFNAGIDRATCHSMLALTGHLPFNAGIDRTLAIQCWHWQDTCHSMLALTGPLAIQCWHWQDTCQAKETFFSVHKGNKLLGF